MKNTLKNVIEEDNVIEKDIENEKSNILCNIIGCIIGIIIFLITILILTYKVKIELIQASNNVIEHASLISNLVPFYVALGTLIYCLMRNIIEYYNL